jgi:hypothetical protein
MNCEQLLAVQVLTEVSSSFLSYLCNVKSVCIIFVEFRRWAAEVHDSLTA